MPLATADYPGINLAVGPRPRAARRRSSGAIGIGSELGRRLAPAIAWLLKPQSGTDRADEARRLARDWGTLAADVARAHAACETAGFFDAPDIGFWHGVAADLDGRPA